MKDIYITGLQSYASYGSQVVGYGGSSLEAGAGPSPHGLDLLEDGEQPPLPAVAGPPQF